MILSQSSIFGQNPKILYQEFNGLQTPKLSKKQLCDRTPESGDTRMLALEIRLALGRPLRTLGEHRRQLTLIGEAETLARALDDRARLVRVLTLKVNALNMAGDPDGAIVTGRQALELAAAL